MERWISWFDNNMSMEGDPPPGKVMKPNQGSMLFMLLKVADITGLSARHDEAQVFYPKRRKASKPLEA